MGAGSVEEASYDLVRKDNQFEIRDYAPMVVAQTRVTGTSKQAGSKAFRKLFKYISGENESSEKIAMTAPVISEANDPDSSDKDAGSGEKIAMTAPVISQKDGEAWLYKFVLPDSFTMDNAPRPLNPEVSLAEIAPRRVATIRYSGRATEKARIEHTEKLVNWIDAQALVRESEPRWAGYDAPWKLPALRRNEVLIDISNQ